MPPFSFRSSRSYKEFGWDDSKSVLLVVGGSKAEKQNLADTIKLFDIAPKRVQFRIELKSVVDKYSSTTTTIVDNNHTWLMREDAIGLGLSLGSRINGDGTVTLHVDVSEQPQGALHPTLTSGVVVIKNRATSRVLLTAAGELFAGIDTGAQKKIGGWPAGSGITLTPIEVKITATIQKPAN